MWKWFAGADCLYSTIVAYFGTTNVWGQVGVDILQTALANLSGKSTVSASSHISENILVREL